MPLSIPALMCLLLLSDMTSLIGGTSAELGDESPILQTSHLNDAKQLRLLLVQHIAMELQMIGILDEWVAIEVTNITGTNKLSPTNFNYYNETIADLRQDFSELATEFERKQFDNVSIGSLRVNAATLLDKLIEIDTDLDNETRNALTIYSDYLNRSNIVDRFQHLYNDSSNINGLINEAEQTVLSSDCINAIRNKNFNDAALNLKKITEDTRIEQIVETLFLEKPKNFLLILNFINNVNDFSNSVIILRKLHSELRLRGESNANRLLLLVKSLKSKMSDPLMVEMYDDSVTDEADRLLKLMKPELKNYSVMKLTDIIESISTADYKLLRDIYDIDQELFLEICHQTYLYSDQNRNTAARFETMFTEVLKLSSALERRFSYYNFIRTFFKEIGEAKLAETASCPPLHQEPVIRAALCNGKVNLKSDNYRLTVKQGGNVIYFQYVYAGNNYNSQYWKLEHLKFNFYRIISYSYASRCLIPSAEDDYEGAQLQLGDCNHSNNTIWKLRLRGNPHPFKIKHMITGRYLTSDSTDRTRVSMLTVPKENFLFDIEVRD